MFLVAPSWCGAQQTRSDLAERAKREFLNQQYAAAARTLERATQGSDNRYDSKYWLALAERGQGHMTQAGATLDQLLAGQPDHQLGLEAKVRLGSDQKDWQAALAAQARLSALRPGSADAQCRLGDLFLRSKSLDKAEEPLQKGLRLE